MRKKKKKISLAGRIKKKRNFGSIIFSSLLLWDGEIQIKFNSLLEEFSKVKVGDIIGVKGIVCRTEKGTLTVHVKEFVVLSKCYLGLPDSHYGLVNVEERFRKRYLDLIVNQKGKKILVLRHKTICLIRNFLDNSGFIEIETPILVSEASGAQAKPFVTFHNKLRKDFFLRIATEIPLKKLLIGGFQKIYEIGKIFRNEGIDARHNPEFTTIEIYCAYKDSDYMMNLTERIFSLIVKKNIPEKKMIFFNGHKINVFEKFRRKTMNDLVAEETGVDFSRINLEQALIETEKRNLELKSFEKNIGHILYLFFSNFVERKLIQPTFVLEYPLEVSPLSKAKKEDKTKADRFELFIAGLEFANGYSELNDPWEQRKRFQQQEEEKKLGQEEIASMDDSFIEALMFGMPPAGGLGIGIDRLIMFLTESDSIKEVISFPQLKDK